MLPTNRFLLPNDDDQDVARQLFENAGSLSIHVIRRCDEYDSILRFELKGGVQDREADLVRLAAKLLRAFYELPSESEGDDEDDA